MSAPENIVPVVGIGASAGGLEALREVFQAHRSETGLAFVIIQHLDPTHESLMAQLIERYTQMEVRQAKGGERLEADRIYVIPPGHGLAIQDGCLELTEFSDPRGQRRPIDDFFDSLAKDRQDMAAAVILSGTGADGSRGLRAIKEQGGLAIAQTPDTARYDGMPVSALSTGLVDVVADPGDVMEILNRFFSRTRDGDLEDEAEEVTDHIDELCDVLREAVGHDFSRYKRNTLTRRVARRMQVLSIDEAENYIKRIRSDEDECQALFQDLLINVTQFFRDKEEFEGLNALVIDKLVRLSRDGQEVRVWVPGASSGEEAYSIAIMFAEAMRRYEKRPYIQIFATDIDDKMLDIARSASYPLSALADIPIELQHRYVIGNTDSFSFVPQVRDMVRFSLHNLVRDPPFSKIDLVSCRNLLIYFDDSLQKQVLPLFHFALRDSGYLFLGTSEGIGRFEDLFEVVDQKSKIFRRKNVKSNYSLQIGRQAAPVYSRRRQRQTTSDEPRVTNSSEIAAAQRVADKYAPVSFLVDEEGTLLQKWGAAGKFLEFPDRIERNVHIPTLALPGLRETIGPLLRSAVEGQKKVIANKVSVTLEYGMIDVAVLCEPLESGGYLIVIREIGALRPFEDDEAVQFEAGDGQLQFLEQELQSTRHRLRSTVEELETTNEELKSSNEEMMSMNEELQSTNEELTTVNDELKVKVDQVTVANADLKNFFDNTELVVIVVDAHMMVRSFTDAAAQIFALTERDIGRPLTDVHTKLDSREFIRAALEASSEGSAAEYRTRTQDGTAEYIARVIPYRRLDGTIDGATLVFTDVTQALRMERELREERERLRLALEVAKVGIWEYDPSSDVTVLDEKERQLLGLSEAESGFMEPILARMDSSTRDRINAALRQAMDGKKDFDEVFVMPLPDGSERWLHGLGRRIQTADSDEAKFIGATYDVTSERRQLEEREMVVREMNHRVKNLFAIIAAMVSMVRRDADDLDQFAEALRSRIHALGRSHSLTANATSVDDGIELADLVDTVLEPIRSGQTIEVSGDAASVPIAKLTPLAMILYEWTTNATKYGGLSVPEGSLKVSWRMEDGTLSLSWSETGRHDDAPQTGRTGFGSRLIDVTARQLGGEALGEATDEGYRRTLTFNL